MGQIYIEIENLASLVDLLTEAKKKGLMKDISVDKVERAFRNRPFPMRVPVSLDSLLDLAGNPMVRKMFGKKMENATLGYLEKAIRTGS